MKNLITLLLVGIAMNARAQQPPGPGAGEESAKTTYRGDGFEITGPAEWTRFGRLTFREGRILWEGKQYKVVTASLYGNIGAVSVEEGEKGKRFLYLTSSFAESVQGEKLSMWAQSYAGCEGRAYNAVAIVYDVDGVSVTDHEGTVLNLQSAADVKKKLFPALISNPANSKWSAGACLNIEKVTDAP